MFRLHKEHISVGPHTEKEGEWSISTPRKKNEERHPEKSELYAKVDGLAMCKRGWGGRLSEIMAEHMTDKVDNGDCTICRIGNEGEQDETKPSREMECNRYTKGE
jgi:hypothetical protein